MLINRGCKIHRMYLSLNSYQSIVALLIKHYNTKRVTRCNQTSFSLSWFLDFLLIFPDRPSKHVRRWEKSCNVTFAHALDSFFEAQAPTGTMTTSSTHSSAATKSFSRQSTQNDVAKFRNVCESYTVCKIAWLFLSDSRWL